MQIDAAAYQIHDARGAIEVPTHLPVVRASHGMCRQGPATFGALRDKITTDDPADVRCSASDTPRKPLPPAITIGPANCVVLILPRHAAVCGSESAASVLTGVMPSFFSAP